MLVIKGKYGVAKVMIDDIDVETRSQIQTFVNHPVFEKTNIVIMPDCHAGSGAVIGFTAPLNEYVIPNVVGVDIGCGIEAFNLGSVKIDYEKLDHKVRSLIPLGFSKRSTPRYAVNTLNKLLHANIEDVCFDTNQKLSDVISSVGTLGGGNHFIEIDENGDEKWLVIHSGSRNFGLRVATFHQDAAKSLMKKMFIGDAYKDLEYLPRGLGGNEYLADMMVAQKYAELNRKCISEDILSYLCIEPIDHISSVHNYISDDGMIRKGAISAESGQRLIIPLNMRDGSIIGTGKGSNKWNCSAPHGAGRLMSRSQAKKTLTLDEFKMTMEGVFSTSISYDTLDESPMSYKRKEVILEAIEETVEVDFIMKPVWNLKAGEKIFKRDEA